MNNDEVRSVELDQNQLLMLLVLCGRQMVRDANHGYHDPILASATVELVKAMVPQTKDNAREQIPG